MTPLFTWVAVVGRGDEAQRGAVFLSFVSGRGWPSRWSARRESPLKVFERQAGTGAVLGAQYDEARCSGVCGRFPAGEAGRAERHDDLFVKVGKAHAAPAQAAAGPGGDAVKVRGLLDAWELRERVAYIGADVGRSGRRGRGGATAVGKADVQVDAVGLAGEARRERGEAEAREVRAFALAGG